MLLISVKGHITFWKSSLETLRKRHKPFPQGWFKSYPTQPQQSGWFQFTSWWQRLGPNLSGCGPAASLLCPTFMGSFCLSTAWMSVAEIVSFLSRNSLFLCQREAALLKSMPLPQAQPAFRNYLVLGLWKIKRTSLFASVQDYPWPFEGATQALPPAHPPRHQLRPLVQLNHSFSICPTLFPLLLLGKTEWTFQNVYVTFCAVTIREEDRGGKQLAEGLKLEVKWTNRWRRQKKGSEIKLLVSSSISSFTCAQRLRGAGRPQLLHDWKLDFLSLVSPISFSYLLIHFLFSTHPSNLCKLLDNVNIFNS